LDPEDAIATLIPITFPLEFRSAPPEFPGLIAASVWITAREIVEDVPVVVPVPPPWPGRSKFQKL